MDNKESEEGTLWNELRNIKIFRNKIFNFAR